MVRRGLLARMSEDACARTWPDLRHKLDRLLLGTFTGPVGTCCQPTRRAAKAGDRCPQRHYLLAMAIARFKDLCLDAGDPGRLGAFWAAVLGRTWQAKENGEGLLTGPTPQHTIWVNQVPEAKTVKHRVHLDIYARDRADLEALGATVVEPRRRWTVMADPEGGEFCAFVRPQIPAERLHGLVVDSADPARRRGGGRVSTASASPRTTAGSPWRACPACRSSPWTSSRYPSRRR
jgi:hypothetical protein